MRIYDSYTKTWLDKYLKIAVVTPWAVRCGIFTYTRDLFKAVAAKGHEVYVVRLPRFGRKTSELVQMVAGSVPANRIDLIVVSHEYGLYQGLEDPFYAALRSLRKPIVTIMHATGNPGVDEMVARGSDVVVVHNHFCAERFDHDCCIIPHGCTPMACPPVEECKRALGIDAKIPVVGYLGYVSPAKGLETLVNAVRDLPGVALLIGGGWFTEGGETDYIRWIKQYSLEVLRGRCMWLGYVEEERLPEVYGAMDLFCYPSRFTTESGALITALAHGRVALASRLPPFKEKEDEGALTTFKGEKELVEKIDALLRMRTLWKHLEKGARRYVEAVSWPVISERHINLYEEIIGRGTKVEPANRQGE
jgi:glycosyltransferase involved in cell wall biosynthesis